MLGLESQLVLEKNDGSKLRSIVFDVEAVRLTLDDGVTSGNTDVVNSHLTLVASSQFELILLWSHCQKMDVSRCIFVKGH